MADANDFPIADQLRDWQSTDRFNDWRTREEVWREAADGVCIDIAAAKAHALTAQTELVGDWPVLETAHDPEDSSHAGLCLDVRLKREGFIEISYHAVEGPRRLRDAGHSGAGFDRRPFVDVTLDELCVELLHPANTATERFFVIDG